MKHRTRGTGGGPRNEINSREQSQEIECHNLIQVQGGFELQGQEGPDLKAKMAAT